MYTLFWELMSGAIAPQIMFEEMGVEFKKVAIDMENGEHLTPAYLALNPTGKVPAVKLSDGVVIGESAAIVQTLGERHPESNLVPAQGSKERPEFLFWLTYMAATGYMTIARANHPERHTTDQNSIEPVRLSAEQQIDQFYETIDGAIKGSPFFLLSGYTALDIYLTMLTTWHADKAALFEKHSRIAALCKEVAGRPAYTRVMDDHRT